MRKLRAIATLLKAPLIWRRAGNVELPGIPVSPKCARRFSAMALIGAPLSTPSRAGLPLTNARTKRWFWRERVSGSASKRGREEFEAGGFFGAAGQISAAVNKVTTTSDNSFGRNDPAGTFTRRRITRFVVRESGFAIYCYPS